MTNYVADEGSRFNLRELKLATVVRCLEFYNGNKTHAARALGISLRSIRLWIKTHDELKSYRG